MSIKTWEICEQECFEFLKNNYEDNNIHFMIKGSSNSNISDIQVFKKNVACFFIETKMKQAQCGQFVVLPSKDGHFVYSTQNKYPACQQTNIIIDYMNNNYDYFLKPGTKGKELKLGKKFFYSWIINYYKAYKDVKYFIIEKECGRKNLSSDNFVIFPVEHLSKYVDVSATYREKKSGSSIPPYSSFSDIEKLLKNNNYSFESPSFYQGKVYIEIHDIMNTFKLKGQSHDYLFNHKINEIFEIRRLSNTRNSNVIFSIYLIHNQNMKDIYQFQQDLKL